MAHFGRAGPPDIKDSYSLLVLNITFHIILTSSPFHGYTAGTTADDLYPLFDRYGKVVDIFIPRDRRTGDSRGFAFVRYKYADEAEKAIERLDGRNVDGRDIVVQFAKYGPNAEVIRKGRLTAEPTSSKRHRSSSPQRSSKRFNADYRSRDHRRRSRSRDRHDNDRYQEKEREYHRRSLSHSASPHSPSRSRSRDTNDRRTRRSRSHSVDSRSPVRHSRSHRSLTPQHHVPDKSSPSTARSPAPASLSPNARNKSPKPPSMSPSNSGA